MNQFKIFLALLLSLSLLNCDQRDDIPAAEKEEIATEEADSFIHFINRQASLAAGDYVLVVSPSVDVTTGVYSVSLNINGEGVRVEGTWTDAQALNSDEDVSPSHAITLDVAGGLTTITASSVTAYLYLKKNGHIIAEGTELDLPTSQIDSQTYTDAYYAAVDPLNERSTLRNWKTKNGFDQGEDVHVVFRDTKDLGYGRNMHARRDPDTGNISFWVRNYAANLGGDVGQYGPANLAAGIAEMKEYHIGTNAIEFSPIDPDDPDSEKILKFFTFRSDEAIVGATEYRKDTTDLDGRGVKQMPIPCLVCHGARLLPLDENGEFQLLSLRSAKLNQLELDTFQLADSGEFSAENIESGIKLINEYVNEVYAEIGEHDVENKNRWESDFALEISQGRYGGEEFPETTYQGDYIPEGWKQTVDRPEGVEVLFSEVIQPHCVSCHSIRGKTVAEVNKDANDINFSTYEKFISYNDKLIDYVFDRGLMPLSLLNFNKFWEEPEGAPAILASFLDGYTGFDANNLPVEPGLPVAQPGQNRSAWTTSDTSDTANALQLNASASYFTETYSWAISSQPASSAASFSNTDIANPFFFADTDGPYILSLTVSNALGSHTDSTTITIESGGGFLSKHQNQLTFVDDIMEDIMGASTGQLGTCSNCHRSNQAHNNDPLTLGYDGKYDGIPVFYSLYDDDGEINKNLYRHVRARINFSDPQNSLLLRKPIGLHHGGGEFLERSTFSGEQRYQTLLNWIREGAICGEMDDVCQ